MAEEKKDSRVKVVDRRWLSTEGEPLETAAPAPTQRPAEPPPPPVEPPPPASPPSSAATADPERPESGEATGPGPEAGFLDLVDFLAQQAAALLSGQIPGRGRDPATARFFIDLLGVVKDKTAGQLVREEASYLDDVLYQLRSLFLAATR
ncbi:MAG TPA: DUF1844 domain-containing protein [Thermoanaerobaculaceae bacterium]|nr:DUF1844 domain-containing protein [Thermoanaerobaculaceae bacterium]